ncbi:hypothetical protein BD414DRAFT_474635 [Trametes punicea]|nr:hypothetical protein BD414DRAFT_474635 [Trametes punicea]
MTARRILELLLTVMALVRRISGAIMGTSDEDQTPYYQGCRTGCLDVCPGCSFARNPSHRKGTYKDWRKCISRTSQASEARLLPQL